jgi:hypothetical protein
MITGAVLKAIAAAGSASRSSTSSAPASAR